MCYFNAANILFKLQSNLIDQINAADFSFKLKYKDAKDVFVQV